MRKIKITVVKMNPEKNSNVTFQIVEQTHKGKKFGFDGTCRFKASNGIDLVSNTLPESRGNILYVRGWSNSEDRKMITTSKEIFKKIEQAIKEYNEKGKYGNNGGKMKEIKRELKVKIVGEDRRYTYIQIIKQTHRGEEFTPNGNSFISKIVGIQLESAFEPEYDRFSKRLFVRGEEKNYDENIIRIPKKYWDLVQKAIAEYNSYDEFSKSLEEVIKNLNDTKKEFSAEFDTLLKTMEMVKTPKEFMGVKVQILRLFINKMPTGINHCLFCLMNNTNCTKCAFGIIHGKCSDSIIENSDYDTLLKKKDDLLNSINKMYDETKTYK